MSRLAVLLIVVNGLVPALGEGVETVVHFSATGHFAHSAADEGDLGNLGEEHGCGPVIHFCSCCVSLQLIAGVPQRVPQDAGRRGDLADEPRQRGFAGFRGALFRPPRAA